MSDCFDHHLDAFESMGQDNECYSPGNSTWKPRSKPVSNWVETEIEAKDIDGRPHVEVNGVMCKLKIPTFVRGNKLVVKKNFWEGRQYLFAHQVKGYYDDAGALKWVRTQVPGTKMGDTRYAWNGMDYVPISFPAWIDPETNLISVPDNFLEQLEDLLL